jgi:hypothetical protein
MGNNGELRWAMGNETDLEKVTLIMSANLPSGPLGHIHTV